MGGGYLEPGDERVQAAFEAVVAWLDSMSCADCDARGTRQVVRWWLQEHGHELVSVVLEGPSEVQDKAAQVAAPAPDAQYLGVEGDKRLVGGMDGCRGGWVLVTTPVYGMGDTSIEVVPSIDAVVERLEKGELTAVAIDIPISLPASGPRRCDTDARKMIGPRRNSVFPAPFRGLLGSATYEEAASRSRSISGKSLSRQAFAVLPKIEEVDALMTPERQRVLIEVHPEVSFTALRGRPMEHHKSTSEGRGERLAALRTVFHDVDDVTSVRLPRTNPDDILDALVAAWSARRWMTGTYKRLGGDLDERGLRMEMIA